MADEWDDTVSISFLLQLNQFNIIIEDRTNLLVNSKKILRLCLAFINLNIFLCYIIDISRS